MLHFTGPWKRMLYSYLSVFCNIQLRSLVTLSNNSNALINRTIHCWWADRFALFSGKPGKCVKLRDTQLLDLQSVPVGFRPWTTVTFLVLEMYYSLKCHDVNAWSLTINIHEAVNIKTINFTLNQTISCQLGICNNNNAQSITRHTEMFQGKRVQKKEYWKEMSRERTIPTLQYHLHWQVSASQRLNHINPDRAFHRGRRPIKRQDSKLAWHRGRVLLGLLRNENTWNWR